MEVISKLQDQHREILTKIETQLNNKLPNSLLEQSLNDLEANTLEIIDIHRTIQIFQIDFTTLFNESDFISTSEEQQNFLREVTQNYCTKEEETVIKEAIARNVNNLNETREELKIIYTKLKEFVQYQCCNNLNNPGFQEVGNIAKVGALLGDLQKTYLNAWTQWIKNHIEWKKTFDPKHVAIILLSRHKLLESVNLLNTIWLSLNRQTVVGSYWTPASGPLLPVPFSINNPFSQYILK